MSNRNLPLLVPPQVAEPDRGYWATVTQASPLRIQIDGETAPLPFTPTTLVSGLSVNDRVWVALSTNSSLRTKSRRLVILGRSAPGIVTFSTILYATTTNPTQGSGGTSWGKYVRDPATGWVDCSMLWKFGTTGINVGAGSYFFELPHIINTGFHINAGTNGQGDSLGTGFLRDNNLVDPYPIFPWYTSNISGPNGRSTVQFYALTSDATPQLISANPTNPFTFAEEDAIRINVRYLSS